MFNQEIPEEITAEDMMSDDFWRSFGIEPIHLDPNDENSLKQVAERLGTEVKKIRESEVKGDTLTIKNPGRETLD